jgi:membrane-associated phospholipid phosphatase
VPVLAVLLSSAASAGSLDSRELLSASDLGFSLAVPASPGAGSGFGLADRSWPQVGGLPALPGWRGFAPLRLSLSLPEPSFASRLRWEIAYAAPVPAPPAASGFTGWLPSILLVGAFAAVQFGLDPPADSRWTDRNGFDSEIRSVLRGGSRDTRKAADIAGDALLYGMGAALVADWWWLREEYGFLRSVQVDSRWILASNLTTRIAKISAGRQRPYVQPCGRNPDYIPGCGGGRDKNASFFSGHASNTAVVAGLLCARHLHRRDSDASDIFVCGGAAAGALATGVLRIVSEHHFATDVIAGWAVGALFGYLLPSRFDYLGEPDGAFALSSFTPLVGRDFYGFHYAFRF